MLPWLRSPLRQPYGSPTFSLILLFLAWKVVLLAIALGTPGPGYDTSTQLLLEGYGLDGGVPNLNASGVPSEGSALRIVESLTRWDAIYFASIGVRGRVYEQEWAFGWGWTELLNFLCRKCSISNRETVNVAMIGIFISNACHLLSVLVLERIVRAVDAHGSQGRVSFIAAALHIFSPAGLFLSAPYAESLFSLLSFLGHLTYVCSCQRSDEVRSYRHEVWLLASGVCFGLATTIRSNGVLFGLIFAYDALVGLTVLVREYPKTMNYWLYASTIGDVLVFVFCKADMLTHAPSAWPLWYWGIFGIFYFNLGLISLRYINTQSQRSANQETFNIMRQMTFTIAAGLCVAVGLVYPQYLAYMEYCLIADKASHREWCSKRLPSIFSWVQSHYWNVGPFKYWTLSNAPLFILAAPMLTLLLLSSSKYIPVRISDVFQCNRTPAILQRFALPQAAIAILALTSFHVQIISRIASGYPIWYLYIAQTMSESSSGWQKAVIQWIVMYSCIQGVLYSGFLPPA